jgi:hypothetical protein
MAVAVAHLTMSSLPLADIFLPTGNEVIVITIGFGCGSDQRTLTEGKGSVQLTSLH